MNRPIMTDDNPCESHVNIKTGGYCPICMGIELDNVRAAFVRACALIAEEWMCPLTYHDDGATIWEGCLLDDCDENGVQCWQRYFLSLKEVEGE